MIIALPIVLVVLWLWWLDDDVRRLADRVDAVERALASPEPKPTPFPDTSALDGLRRRIEWLESYS